MDTHILLDEGRVGRALAHLLPGRNVVGRETGQVMEMRLNGVGHAVAPHEPLKQARTGQTIGPMQPGAGDLAHRIEPAECRLPPLVHPYPPTGIVGAGDHRHEVRGNIHPVLQALRVDRRKVLANAVLGDVRAQIQIDVGHVFAEHLMVDTARHHVARGQVVPLRVVVLHERRRRWHAPGARLRRARLR